MNRNPRKTALTTLLRLEQQGGLLSDVFPDTLRASDLKPVDVNLATELVYGTVRMRNYLDFYLDQVSRRPIETLDATVRQALRLGAYQILRLQRIPHAAAVNESVKLAPRQNRRAAAGFINGVLRNLIRRKESIQLPSMDEHPIRRIAIEYSHPRWMVKRWIARFGLQGAIDLCRANNEYPNQGIRVNTLKTDTDELQTYLETRGFSVKPSVYVPDVLVASRGSGLVNDPRFAKGHYYLQNESSALVAHAVSPRPNELVYDLCSAPGGKSTHLAQSMDNRGTVVAVDQSAERLVRVQENAHRLGITILKTLTADARTVTLDPCADRVLVDAPCSGLGVMRHKPDIRWNKTEEDIHSVVPVQQQILAQAGRLTRTGGTLVYSTCSTEPEENTEVIHWFLEEFPEFAIEPLPSWFPQSQESMLQVLPQIHGGMDGFFIVRMKKSWEKKGFLVRN